MSKGTSLAIQYYSYKVEFALRGAPHIHGVLWVDWDKTKLKEKVDVQKIKDALRKIKHDEKLGDCEKMQ